MNSVGEITKRLRKAYGDPRTALRYKNPLQLLIATMLSAQCTDERVNKVTPKLFARFKTANDFAEAELSEIEELVRSTGFYKQKARFIKGACKAIVERFNGEVPENMEDLLSLPGVARKTANVLLNNAFNQASGIVVDTHVKRVGKRLGLHSGGSAERIEEELMSKIPRKNWIFISHALIEHGRAVCKARKPLCNECFLSDICPSAFKE